MICIKPERYPFGIVKKLQAYSASPFKILKKLGSNVYAIDIPSNYGISSTFNVVDLLSFKGPTIIHLFPMTLLMILFLLHWLILSLTLHHLFSQKAHSDIIDVIFDEQSLFTKDGIVQNFLVCWRGWPKSNCTWITREELQ